MAYRSSASAAAAAASVTVTKPTGTVDDDLLVAGVSAAAGAAITAPAGWTQWGSEVTAGASRGAFFWKRASSEGADYTFTSTGASNITGKVSAYSGGITTGDPQDGVTTAVSASGTTHTVTGFTTTDTDDLVTMYLSLTTNSTFTPPTNFTERLDVNAGALNTRDTVASGATGDPASASTGTIQCAMLFVALKPPPSDILLPQGCF